MFAHTCSYSQALSTPIRRVHLKHHIVSYSSKFLAMQWETMHGDTTNSFRKVHALHDRVESSTLENDMQAVSLRSPVSVVMRPDLYFWEAYVMGSQYRISTNDVSFASGYVGPNGFHVFDPEKSSTYTVMPCSSEKCKVYHVDCHKNKAPNCPVNNSDF